MFTYAEDYILETPRACSPLGPLTTSNWTLSVSLRVLNPSPTISLKWTNTSSPVSRVINPKPLASLNHLTVPFSKVQLLYMTLYPPPADAVMYRRLIRVLEGPKKKMQPPCQSTRVAIFCRSASGSRRDAEWTELRRTGLPKNVPKVYTIEPHTIIHTSHVNSKRYLPAPGNWQFWSSERRSEGCGLICACPPSVFTRRTRRTFVRHRGVLLRERLVSRSSASSRTCVSTAL
jgi:hypothetical protein